MSETTLIKPGTNIDLVIKIDFSKEQIIVRKSLVYDVRKKVLVLAQPNPPLANYNQGKRIAVTYLARGEKMPLRYGFYVDIVDFIKEYQLSSGQHVSALLVEQQTEPIEFNLRMYYRISPTLDSNITFLVKGMKVSIINVSIGGAQVSNPQNTFIRVGDTVDVTIEIDGNSFDLEAKVLRVWHPPNHPKVLDLEFFAIKFSKMDRTLEDILSRKIRKIERELRFKEMFP